MKQKVLWPYKTPPVPLHGSALLCVRLQKLLAVIDFRSDSRMYK